MITDDVRKAIEEQWRARARSQDYKPGTAKYRKMELEFFMGAMTTINALFPNQEDPGKYMSEAVPVAWLIRAMSGQVIVEKR